MNISAIAGGGWVYEKGKGFVKLNQTILRGGKFYNSNKEIIDITTLGIYSTAVYAEYGLTDKFTGIIYTPLFVRSVLNETRSQNTGQIILNGDEHNNIGDSDIGIKYGLFQDGKIKVATSLILGLPIGTTKGGDTKLLQTGDGEFNQLFQVDVSTAYKSFYGTVTPGINNRTKGFSDEFRFGSEVGYYNDYFLIATKFNMLKSLFNGKDVVASSGIFSNNLEYTALTIEGSVFLTKHWGVTTGITKVYSARNILAVAPISFGIFYK